MLNMPTLTIQVSRKTPNLVKVRSGKDVISLEADDPERIAEIISAWLSLAILSESLRLTEKEAKRIAKKVEEGVARRLDLL